MNMVISVMKACECVFAFLVGQQLFWIPEVYMQALAPGRRKRET